jgi:hypothetical protein
MALHYVDPAAAGANNGTSWTDAWTNVQSAFDTATAGDTVYCRGTQTTAAQIDVDTQTGTNAGGFIKFIGCNAAGTVDGTRFTIQGDGANACHLLYLAGAINMIWLQNFALKNAHGAASSGLTGDATARYGWVFINVAAFGCGQYGMALSSAAAFVAIKCTVYLNGSHGMNNSGTGRWICCSFHDNVGNGADFSTTPTLIGCVCYDNADGFSSNFVGILMFGSVIDGNTDDGLIVSASASNYYSVYLACRITNHTAGGSIGLDCNSEPVLTGWNYFENNTGANIQNDSLHYFIPNLDGTTTNVEDQGNINQGYTDLTDGSENYNLRSDASLRRIPVTIPTS